MKTKQPLPFEFPFRPDMIDRCPWMLYSWLHVPAGSETKDPYHLFAEPLNFDRRIEDTNLLCANRFPAPQSFQFRSFHVLNGTMHEDDRAQVRQRYMLEIRIGQKVYQQAPLLALPGEPRFVEKAEEGRVPQPGYFPDDFPLVIYNQMYFEVNLRGNPFVLKSLRDGGKGLHLLVVLNGLLDREVQ